MPNGPPEEIAELISERLREIEEQLSGENRRLEIRVPPGVVRPVEGIRSDYAFLANKTVRRNLCYAVQALDFYRWLVNRFRLYGPVASYLFKTGIILVNMIIEALVYDFLRQKGVQPASKHSKNIRKLRNQCRVPKDLCDKMDQLRELRSNLHLHRVTDLETEKYGLKDWNRAIVLLRQVREYCEREVGGPAEEPSRDRDGNH